MTAVTSVTTVTVVLARTATEVSARTTAAAAITTVAPATTSMASTTTTSASMTTTPVKGDGIADNVFLLRCLLRDRCDALEPLSVAFLGVLKAFDSMSHASLLLAAERMGCLDPLSVIYVASIRRHPRCFLSTASWVAPGCITDGWSRVILYPSSVQLCHRLGLGVSGSWDGHGGWWGPLPQSPGICCRCRYYLSELDWLSASLPAVRVGVGALRSEAKCR